MTVTGKLSCLIDTSVFVAFFNREDILHHQAVAAFKHQRAPLLMPDVVVNESLALLRKRVSKIGGRPSRPRVS